MKITGTDKIFDATGEVCMGIVAVKGANNRGYNKEADAFRRRSCTEVNLFLRIQKDLAVKERTLYHNLQKELGMKLEDTVLDRVCKDYTRELGIGVEGKKKATEFRHQATLDELIGSDVLTMENPLSDMVRSAMIRFHVPVEMYDMKDGECELVIRDDFTVVRGESVLADSWLGPVREAVTEDTKNLCILITGMAGNRKVVAAARNELARRIKSAFGCDVETGWLEGSQRTFVTDI